MLLVAPDDGCCCEVAPPKLNVGGLLGNVETWGALPPNNPLDNFWFPPADDVVAEKLKEGVVSEVVVVV